MITLDRFRKFITLYISSLTTPGDINHQQADLHAPLAVHLARPRAGGVGGGAGGAAGGGGRAVRGPDVSG